MCHFRPVCKASGNLIYYSLGSVSVLWQAQLCMEVRLLAMKNFQSSLCRLVEAEDALASWLARFLFAEADQDPDEEELLEEDTCSELGAGLVSEASARGPFGAAAGRFFGVRGS